MLVLTRRPGEKVVFEGPHGEPIEVMVVAIRGDHVRLGITAAEDVQIYRPEARDRAPKAKPAKGAKSAKGAKGAKDGEG